MAEAAPNADRRERLALALLTPLLVGILVAAARCEWHSPFCVDNRTYLEMTQGIARHGLPIVDNGPARAFPALQIRWDQVNGGGHLWGSYPPLYPYLAAPFFALGGARLVTQANIALLAVLALGVYRLGRRLTRDPVAGAAAAWVTLCATHVWTFSFDVSPYTTMITAGTWSVALTADALDEGGRRGRSLALLAGLLGAAAAGAHMLAMPVLCSVLLCLATLPASGESPPSPLACLLGRARAEAARAWLPSSQTPRRGALAVVGALAVMVPIALLNRYRFGSFNPMSGGRCVWFSCRASNLAQQGLGAMLRFNAPLFVWAAALATGLLAARRSRVATAAVWIAALCALVPPSPLQASALGVATLFTAFVFDLSRFDLGFWRPPDHMGVFLGPHAIKSLLQSAPALAAAAAVTFSDPRDRRLALVVALPAAAVLTSLVLRGEVALAFALGFPFLDLRYVTPMLPSLAVLAIAAARPLGWRPWHVAVIVALTAVAWRWCANAPDDIPYARRVVLLRGTLALAALALLCVAYARAHGARAARAAAIAAFSAALAMSAAVNLGIDLRAWMRERTRHDEVSSRIGAATPRRFGLLGLAGGNAIDSASSLRVSRDLQYADVEEVEGRFERFRPLVDHWESERRPIFVLMPPGFQSPWPDYRADLLDPRVNLYALRRREPAD